MLGLAASLQRGGASLLTFVKDNLKLYLDFKSNKSDTLKFPSEGSTEFVRTSSQYIDVGNPDNLKISGALTISVWIKTSTNNQYMWIAGKDGNDTSSQNRNYLIQTLNNGTIQFNAYPSDGSSRMNTTSTTNIADGKWHHIVGVYEPSNTFALYVDNVKESELTSGIATALMTSDIDFAIGRQNNSTPQYYYDGKMANLAVWSRALTPEEIQSIMNKSYSQLKGVEKTSLVSWWGLDSASNGVVQPATGEVLGSELALDGGFDTDVSAGNASDDWYIGPQTHEISNGRYRYTDSATGTLRLRQGGSNKALTLNKLHKLTFEIFDNNAKITIATNAETLISLTTYNIGTHTVYFTPTASHFAFDIKASSISPSFSMDNVSLKEVTSNTGVVTGATTTTSVYGGNAPILPRAVDVAKEGQADAIGDGSALFNGSTDHVELSGSSPSNAFSISAWVFDTHASGSDFSAIYSANNTTIWFGVKNNSSGLVRLHVNGNPYVDTPSGSFSSPSNEWIHLACTWDGTNAKIYINGISQTLTTSGTPSNPSAQTDPHIGINSTNSGLNQWTGSISQVGIWQGALTQAQIQSVMESTSYSNIPADVKSTLGAETLTHDFSDGTGVTVPSELSVASGKTTFNGEMVVNGGDVSSAYYSIADNVTWDTSKLYKIVVVCSAYTSGALSHQGGSRAFGVTFGISSSIGGVGTFTNYAVPSSDGLITLRSQSFVGTLSSISIKEVTNDIVAYYPLDEDSSDTSNGAGITNDVTTGEVLGSEILTTNVNTDWTAYGSNDVDNVTDGVKITHDDNAGGAQRTIAGSSGKLYKVVFNAYYSGGTAPNVKVWTGAVNSGTQALTTSSTQHIIYFVNAGTSSLYFDSVNGSQEIFITNLSAKEVTSNTGVLN